MKGAVVQARASRVAPTGRVARRARPAVACVVTTCLVSGFSGTVFAQQTPPGQTPRFRASVEVTTLDVSVVDDRGKPLVDLTSADFTVRVDGNVRRVVSAEWVPLVSDSGAPPPPAPPDGYSTNEASTGGRLIVLAVDEPNIRFGGALAIAKAANAFIDRLSPSDRVAVAGFGIGAPATAFTADRARTKQAINRLVGQKQAVRLADLGHNIGLAEALVIEAGDRSTLDSVISRECQNVGGRPDPLCPDEVSSEAHEMASEANRRGDQTIVGLRELFTGLRGIEGPKTLILISEGFVLNDRALVVDIGSLAAAARTSVYALKLDNQLFDISDGRVPRDQMGDRQVLSEGLETVAAAARGTLFTVVGTATSLFDRIQSEISGYYLVGVESDPRDRDGKPHPIRVDTSRRGAQVRSRRQILSAPADQGTARSPHQAVAAALSSPLLVSALPLRVASFALQGPERDRVQILIHADVGTDYSASKVVTAAYVIADTNGRTVDNKSFDARLLPIMSGVPSALQYKAGASLPPGDYTLKLAVAEGDRVGTVEHVIHATLPQAGALAFSELMVGGPIEVGEILQPTIGYQVTFGAVHGYFEAYGADAGRVSVEYEVAADETSPALIDVDVAPHPVGDSRTIFTRVLPIQQLPPGKYLLRAVVSVDNREVKTLVRGFEVSPPRVLMTSAEGLGSMAVDTGLFLPVDDGAMSPKFHSEHAAAPEIVAPFRDRVPTTTPGVREAFDQGLAFLTAGDYPKAEVSFKRAIQPEADSTAALAYLAVSFAAAGHDIEAASAFQTALVDGSDLPQIYEWLGGTLMRNHDLGEARAIFEEAVGKWPSDLRFTKPLAMLYGTFGRGREAVRTLERYLAGRHDDRAAYYLGVQWLYTVHLSGAVVHDRAQDLKLAREYADAYASGPQAALVKQWVAFLEAGK
jgi:VWFA-related protein